MDQHIELTDEGGIFCDNPACDWEDNTITREECKEWINRPCPKCGENVLTLEDYLQMELFLKSLEIVSNMTDEQIESLGSKIDLQKAITSDFLKDAEGLGSLSENTDADFFKVEVSTHKGTRATKVRPM